MFLAFLKVPDTSGYCLLNWLTNSTHPGAAVSFVMSQHIYRNYSRVQPFQVYSGSKTLPLVVELEEFSICP